MTAKHLLVTARGSYSYSDDMAEIWQNSIRLLLTHGAFDDVGTLPSDWSVDAHTQTSTDGGWSYDGNYLCNFGGGSEFDPVSWLHDYGVPSWVAMFTSGTYSTHINLSEVAVYPIDTTGRSVGGRSAHAIKDTPLAGNGDADLLPLQISRGISWQTPQLGRRGRGRIFLPGASKVDVNTHGLYEPVRGGDAGDAAQALLEGLAYDGPLLTAQHVRPIVTGKPYADYGVITEVRISDRFDTQRRRRDRLVPTYQTRTPSY